MLALVLTVLAAAASVGHARAPFTLHDGDGAPLQGARVSVVGSAGSTVTDDGGGFRLDPEPAAPFDLAVFDARGTYLGVIHVDAAIASGSRVLQVSRSPLETVTVRAGIAPSTYAPPAAAATLYGGREREQERPDRLADVLQDVPGGGRLEEGQGVVPSLRGLARGRTLLLLDDARVTAERRAGPSATFLDPFAIETVEIVRGPGSVAYGSDAIGGVMHARTPLPRAGALGGRFEAAYGTGLEFTTGAAEVNVPAGSGALLFQARLRDFGDYESPEGTVADSSAKDWGVLARGLFPVGAAAIRFGIQVDRGDDIGKPSQDSDVVRSFYPDEASDRATVGVDFAPRGGFTALELRTFFGRYSLVTDRLRLPDPAGLPPVTERLQESTVDAYDGSVRFVATRPVSGGLLRLGLDAYSRFGLESTFLETNYDLAGSVVSSTLSTTIGNARQIASGLFSEYESPEVASRWTFAAGLRGDYVTTRNSGGTYGDRSTSHASPSGYASATVRFVPAWSLSLQAARGFPDPSLSDRYFVGVTGRGVAFGNPDLEPETSTQLDLALRGSVGRTRLAVYGYQYRIHDLIERFQVGNDFFFRNRGEEKIWGAELEASFEMTKTLAARFGASVVRGRIVDDDSPAADIPPDTATFSLVQTLARWWWRVGLVGVARKDDFGPTETATPGHGQVDAGAGVALGKGFEIRVLGSNLTDASYPGSPDAAAVLAPGRSFSVTLGASF